MTAARHTPHTLRQPRFSGEQSSSLPIDTGDASWPFALRSLLLLHGVASLHDSLLSTLSDADLIALRGSLILLQRDDSTNVA